MSRAMQTARGKARRIGAALRRAGLEHVEVHAHRTRSGVGVQIFVPVEEADELLGLA